MRHFKLFGIATLSLLAITSIAQLPASNQKIEADSAWANLQFGHYGSDFYSTQKALLKYREEGLKFWKTFPKDVRKYDWLLRTMDFGNYLSYWKIEKRDSSFKNILYRGTSLPLSSYSWPINKKSLANWEKLYPTLKKDFLGYYTKHPEFNTQGDYHGGDELKLLVGELKSFLTLSLNKAYRLNGKIDLQKLKTLFTATGVYLKNEKLENPSKKQKDVFNPMGYAFLDRYKELGLETSDLTAFFNAIKNCPYRVLREWAIRKENLLRLTEEPMNFIYKSIKGDTIDLEKMRGKVVLIDFWALTCSVCIERMPVIKAVYDKHKASGFEVLSVCLEGEDKSDRVRIIEKKIGADWPTLMIGQLDAVNSLGNTIWKKYGFWGVPQLLLLDKHGKLVMLNDKLRNEDFEPVVRQLLAKENIKN